MFRNLFRSRKQLQNNQNIGASESKSAPEQPSKISNEQHDNPDQKNDIQIQQINTPDKESTIIKNIILDQENVESEQEITVQQNEILEPKTEQFYTSVSPTKNTHFEFPIVVSKHSTNEEKSAIKFLLDNFVEDADVENVINLNKRMAYEIQQNGNFLKSCSSCNGRCKNCKHCQTREKQIFLLNNAIQKLNLFHINAADIQQEKSHGDGKHIKNKTGRKVILSKGSLETFERLKLKFYNIKTFYPSVYSCEDNILHQWAQGASLTKMNPTLLNARELPIECLI